ncbi:hypothetical protein V6Z12_A07G003900 [Gossypium hirsutum]
MHIERSKPIGTLSKIKIAENFLQLLHLFFPKPHPRPPSSSCLQPSPPPHQQVPYLSVS